MRQHLTLCLSAALLAGLASAQQLPDVAVSRVANGWSYYGQSGGLAAYSFGTTSCNVGNVEIDWQPPWDMPVISQNLYRIVDGHIEQLGYSFLKDSFCAVSEPTCGSCQATPCSTLGVGCADTYGPGLNDGANGWAKWGIDATRGEWSQIPPGPSGPGGLLRGRLQVEVAKLGDPASVYVAESQYVSGHDQLAGLGANNQSWVYARLMNPAQPGTIGSTHMFEPAINAWRDVYPDVSIKNERVYDEGGPGIHGYVWVASKATYLGEGRWKYDYAVQNQTSSRNVGRFAVRSPLGLGDVTSPAFRGIQHHSGSPYSDAPWEQYHTADTIGWATEGPSGNPNANAIRWGTLYSFGFVADSPPMDGGTAHVGLWAAGPGPDALVVQVIVPAGNASCSGPSFLCPQPANSSGAPAFLIADATPVVAANDVELTVSGLPLGSLGMFVMSDSQGAQTPPGSLGQLCLGGTLVRFADQILHSGTFGYVGPFHPNANALPGGLVWHAGETWTFQYWSRDVAGGTSIFSNAFAVPFCQ